MQTTIFSKMLIGVLCLFGVFQIAQLVTNKPLKNDFNPKLVAENHPSVKTVLHATNEESDPNFVIPENAEAYLKDRFALNSQDVEWKKLHYGMEAIFSQGGRTYEVEFDGLGNWVETELENVPAIEIPAVIISAAKALYPTARLSEFEIELTPKGTFYEVEMMTDGGEVELYFDNTGKRIKNENEDK